MRSDRLTVALVDPDGAATAALQRVASMRLQTIDRSTAVADLADPVDCLVVGPAADERTLVAATTESTVPVVVCTTDPPPDLAERATVDSVRPVGDWARSLALRVRRVVAAHRRIETFTHEYGRRIEHLHTSATVMAGLETDLAVYRHVVDTATRVLRFDLCYVGVAVEDWIVPIVRSDGADPAGVRVVTIDEGIVGRTYRTNESFLLEDAATDGDARPASAAYRSSISVPLGDRGVFQAVARRTGAFGRTDLELAELLCAHAAAVLVRIDSQQLMRRERDRFAALFENVPDPVVGYRYDGNEPVVESMNPAFEAVFGCDRRAVGEAIDALIVPDSDRERAARLNGSVIAGERLDVEVEREAADGRRSFLLRNVPLSGVVPGVGYAIYTDITRQKRHQRTLAALQEATRALITAESEAEIGERTVETVRRVLELPYAAVLRYDADADVLRPVAVSETWGSLEEELEEYLTFGAGTSLTRSAFEAGEVRVYDDITVEPDVGRADPKVRGAMLLPIGSFGVLLVGSSEAGAFDETDRDFASILASGAEAAMDRTVRETTLRERERELARQNRRLERFASVVSHDLRNPLTVARGRLGLAREGRPDQLGHVDRALERMETIIDDVLRLTRDGETVEPERVDLADCVRRAWTGVATGGATLSTGELGVVTADASRLQQLLENLFRNAVEHGSTSGREASDDAGGCGEPAVSVRVETAEGAIAVCDDGPGIPLDERERVFAYGYSTEPSPGRDTAADGSGLGLAIVEQVVAAHGWSIRVEEGPSGGARFVIEGVETDLEPSD